MEIGLGLKLFYKMFTMLQLILTNCVMYMCKQYPKQIFKNILSNRPERILNGEMLPFSEENPWVT